MWTNFEFFLKKSGNHTFFRAAMLSSTRQDIIVMTACKDIWGMVSFFDVTEEYVDTWAAEVGNVLDKDAWLRDAVRILKEKTPIYCSFLIN